MLSQLIVVVKFAQGNSECLMQIHRVITVRKSEELEVAIVKVGRSLVVVGLFISIQEKKSFRLADHLFENVNVVIIVEKLSELGLVGKYSSPIRISGFALNNDRRRFTEGFFGTQNTLEWACIGMNKGASRTPYVP